MVLIAGIGNNIWPLFKGFHGKIPRRNCAKNSCSSGQKEWVILFFLACNSFENIFSVPTTLLKFGKINKILMEFLGIESSVVLDRRSEWVSFFGHLDNFWSVVLSKFEKFAKICGIFRIPLDSRSEQSFLELTNWWCNF